MENLSEIVFIILGTMALMGAVGVILVPNPIYSALSLAVTMIAIAGLFFSLDSYFIAGVQLIVYAGAVMVLFVMVVMLFDLRKELQTFSGGFMPTVLKMAGVGAVLGFLLAGLELSKRIGDQPVATEYNLESIKKLSIQLFSKHIFEFEIISVLLLVVIVGSVSVARSRGGTHA